MGKQSGNGTRKNIEKKPLKQKLDRSFIADYRFHYTPFGRRYPNTLTKTLILQEITISVLAHFNLYEALKNSFRLTSPYFDVSIPSETEIKQFRTVRRFGLNSHIYLYIYIYIRFGFN